MVPSQLFTRVGYEQPDGRLHGLGGFVELNYRDAYNIDNAKLVQAPSFAIVNLQAHWDMGDTLGAVPKLRAFFEVQNLFNRVYAASANNISDTLNGSGAQNGAAALRNATGSIYAGSPRAFFGGVKIAL